MAKGIIRTFALALLTAVLAIALAACGSGSSQQAGNEGAQGSEQNTGSGNTGGENNSESELTGEFKIDGSSTVYPITQAVAEEFMKLHSGVNVTVNYSGSSNGFKMLINGDIPIADSSRKIKDEEIAALREKGWEAVEMPVAYDGITVVIHPENDWATEMTVEELKKIWQKDSTVKKWSDVRAGWPDEPIHLYGPGTASGTFEYFTEAINGEAKVSREDYTPSEDDNVLVTGVSGDKYALGYFGYSYYAENTDKLKAVAIKADENSPAVAPSMETINDGSYRPLSREIYIYVRKDTLANPAIQEFIKFYMSKEGGQTLAEEVGYVALPQEKYDANLALLEQ